MLLKRPVITEVLLEMRIPRVNQHGSMRHLRNINHSMINISRRLIHLGKESDRWRLLQKIVLFGGPVKFNNFTGIDNCISIDVMCVSLPMNITKFRMMCAIGLHSKNSRIMLFCLKKNKKYSTVGFKSTILQY